MTVTESMRGMPVKSVPPDPSTPRGAIAAIVWYLIPARGMTYAEVGRIKGFSPATVSRITSAKDSVGIAKLCRMAEILGLPIETFPLILNGDLEAVKKLPMDDRTKDYILGVLEHTDLPRDRRASDG